MKHRADGADGHRHHAARTINMTRLGNADEDDIRVKSDDRLQLQSG